MTKTYGGDQWTMGGEFGLTIAHVICMLVKDDIV